jgi:hypothetical protein
MTPRHVRPVWSTRSTGQDVAYRHRSPGRMAVVVNVTLTVVILAVALIAGPGPDPGRSAAGSAPHQRGVDREVDGLQIRDAYLVPDATSPALFLVCGLALDSGRPDALVGVWVYRRSTTGLASVGRKPIAATALPVSSDLVRIGPEDANHVRVTVPGRMRAAAGSLVTVTLNFRRRGPVSLQLPVRRSLAGPSSRNRVAAD